MASGYNVRLLDFQPPFKTVLQLDSFFLLQSRPCMSNSLFFFALPEKTQRIISGRGLLGTGNEVKLEDRGVAWAPHFPPGDAERCGLVDVCMGADDPGSLVLLVSKAAECAV